MLGTLVYGIARWRGWPAEPARRNRRGPRSINSIAVLPLDNYSGDPNQEYFADGLTDELTTDLATISAIAGDLAWLGDAVQGCERPPTPVIAKVLNVDAVVEGSVVRVGDKVRSHRAVDRRACRPTLWAKSYERDSRDVLAMQDEIARRSRTRSTSS